MGTPYVGEVRLFAGNFAPNGWMDCDGQLLPISENETLFRRVGCRARCPKWPLPPTEATPP